MDARRHKDYMLGLMFYKFLSDKTLETFKKVNGSENITEVELVEEYKKEVVQFDGVIAIIFSLLEYCIHSFTYRTYQLKNIC